MPADPSYVQQKVNKLVGIADGLHASIYATIRAWADLECLRRLRNVAREVRRLAGSLHALHLLVSSFFDDNGWVSVDYNLGFLLDCEKFLALLQSSLQNQESQPQPTMPKAAASGIQSPALGNAGIIPFAEQLAKLPDELGGYCLQLGMALISETYPALLASLSRRKQSLLHFDVPAITYNPSHSNFDRRESLSFLSPIDPWEALKVRRGPSKSSSCYWFANEPKYKAWESSEWNVEASPLLWLTGQPGAGKTTLVASLVERLQLKERAVCWHFVHWRDETTKDPSNILGSLVRQLASQNADAYHEAHRLLKISPEWELKTFVSNGRQKQSNVRKPARLEDLKEAFKRLQGFFDTIYIIIDGVDEIQDVKSIRQLAASGIAEWTNTRIMVVSRRHDTLRDIFQSKNFEVLNIRPSQNDIQNYVKSELQNPSKGQHSGVDEEVTEAMLKAVSGVQK
jgi:GTPase SAR1 family protein